MVHSDFCRDGHIPVSKCHKEVSDPSTDWRSYGYDSGAVTITISQPTWFSFMDEPGPAYVGAVASVYSAGQAFGAMAQSILADRHGRVPFLLLLSVLAVAGIAIQSAAVDMGMFISGRALSGFAAGGTYLTTTLYLCELAPARTRGMFAGCCGLSIGLGMTTSRYSTARSQSEED